MKPTEIKVQTSVRAPMERCFDLSLSIDLHQESTAHTGEEAIAGITSGLIGMGESVNWRAKHLGIWQKFTSKITAFDRPIRFVDEMQKGAFNSFWHEHAIEATSEGCLMTDTIRYTVPLGMLGHCFDSLYLKAYMAKLIVIRNGVIKIAAETDQWKTYLKDNA